MACWVPLYTTCAHVPVQQAHAHVTLSHIVRKNIKKHTYNTRYMSDIDVSIPSSAVSCQNSDAAAREKTVVQL